jgi:peptide/nickel transport system substrate-binding protein
MVTQQVAMRAGTGQVMLLMDPKTMSDMKTAQGFNVLQFPAGSSIIVGDSANPSSHFADKRVMQAINIGIDKKAVADANGYGYMFPSSQLAPLGNPAQVSTIPNNPYDPVKAKQLLADAGYPNGFQTTLNTWQYDVDGALIVQQQLAKIGITSTINNVDNLKFWDYINNGWNDSLMVWSASSGPNFAASFKNLWPPYGSGNKSVKAPDAMKALIDQCLSAVDTADAIKFNQQLNQMIYDNLMIVTYETGGLGTILSPKVHDSDFAFGSDMFLSWRPAKTWLSK